uniref:Uncharacterized protein n=1 Tax=Plectus sambesii TaxID=2011161 RepID=A0A914UTA8_9BILA
MSRQKVATHAIVRVVLLPTRLSRPNHPAFAISSSSSSSKCSSPRKRREYGGITIRSLQFELEGGRLRLRPAQIMRESALTSESKDPATYLFEVTDHTGSAKKTPSRRSAVADDKEADDGQMEATDVSIAGVDDNDEMDERRATNGDDSKVDDLDGADAADENDGKWPMGTGDDVVSVPPPDSVEPRCPFTSEDTVLLHAAAHPHNQPFDSTSLIVHAGDDASITESLANAASTANADESLIDASDSLGMDGGESEQAMEQELEQEQEEQDDNDDEQQEGEVAKSTAHKKAAGGSDEDRKAEAEGRKVKGREDGSRRDSRSHRSRSRSRSRSSSRRRTTASSRRIIAPPARPVRRIVAGSYRGGPPMRGAPSFRGVARDDYRRPMPLMSSRPEPHWDRREMMELMRRKEEEHRKREEELRLQRERERLKFEREKLEREKLELQQLRMSQQQAFMPAYGAPAAPSAYAASAGRRSLADAVGGPFMALDSGIGSMYAAAGDRSRSGPVRADDRGVRTMDTRRRDDDRYGSRGGSSSGGGGGRMDDRRVDRRPIVGRADDGRRSSGYDRHGGGGGGSSSSSSMRPTSYGGGGGGGRDRDERRDVRGSVDRHRESVGSYGRSEVPRDSRPSRGGSSAGASWTGQSRGGSGGYGGVSSATARGNSVGYGGGAQMWPSSSQGQSQSIGGLGSASWQRPAQGGNAMGSLTSGWTMPTLGSASGASYSSGGGGGGGSNDRFDAYKYGGSARRY